VQLAGWLYNLRRSGKIAFPIVRDGSGLMQCVAVKERAARAAFETIKNLTQESSIIVEGKIRAEQRAPGGYEMDWRPCRWCSASPKRTLPITPKEHVPSSWPTIAISGAQPAAARYHSRAPRDYQGHSRLLDSHASPW